MTGPPVIVISVKANVKWIPELLMWPGLQYHKSRGGK